jgi:hypothetical protein
MTSRIARILGAVSLIGLLGSAAPGSPVGPQDDATAKVTELVASTRDVLRYGASAVPVITNQSKASSASTAALLAVVAKSLAGKAAPAGTDTAPAAIEPGVKKLASAAGDVVRLKELALAAIQSAAADPANADVKDVLASAEARIHVLLCAAAIRGYIKPDNTFSGTFFGMFASLDKYDREKVADAFLEIFQGSRQGAALRDLAGEGLAQTGSARHQAAVRELLESAKESERIRRRALYTLARLGDRGPVDRILKNLATRMEQVKKPDMSPDELVGWASGYLQCAEVAQAINDVPAAIKYYESFLGIVEPISDKLSARDTLQNAYYNLACLHSLKGDVEAGLGMLEKSFAAGYSDFTWANTDGDLGNLRKDDRFKAMISKWESARKAGGAPESRPS